jgi:glycerophosphoryl diester phosphodiesterase
MLIIGHRGAAGLAPENTLKALRAGRRAGADILEFDIRLTADHIPILTHNATIKGKRIGSHTLDELRTMTTVTTLDEVLDSFFGKILLNIELKETRGVHTVYETVARYVKRPKDWDNILFSSFKPQALASLRRQSTAVNLGLLHHIDPFVFTRHHKSLNFAAVGFHRLTVNSLALAVAKELGIFTYVYTVDRPDTARRLARRGIDGIVTNYPDRIATALQADA